MAYTDDYLCGSDWYMYEAMVREGNDARLLSFPGGGHKNPQNAWAWKAGCLGLASPCSSSCAASFDTCVNGETGENHAKFKTCEDKLKNGALSGCTVGCAPTLGMLLTSESPVVTLSQGKFGLQTGLTQWDAKGASAPKPSCKAPFGPFSEVGNSGCSPPNSFVYAAENPKDTCGTPGSPGNANGNGNVNPSPSTATSGTANLARKATVVAAGVSLSLASHLLF
jgi:hypothetical protein